MHYRLRHAAKCNENYSRRDNKLAEANPATDPIEGFVCRSSPRSSETKAGLNLDVQG
jgi:hypothetical protein